jgi:hypothetical protein
LPRIQAKGYLEIFKLSHNNKKGKEGQWKYSAVFVSLGVNQENSRTGIGIHEAGRREMCESVIGWLKITVMIKSLPKLFPFGDFWRSLFIKSTEGYIPRVLL